MSEAEAGLTTIFVESAPSRKRLRRARLVVVDGPDKGKDLVIEKERTIAGRSVICDLVLTDKAVSATHVELIAREHGYLLRDLDSRNGTLVGDLRIHEVWIHPGLVFRVGQSLVRFELASGSIDIPLSVNDRFHDLIGKSLRMREIFAILEKVAPTELTVLVRGETGTGKELVARALHRSSRRKDGPLVVQDCSAIPKDLIESTLFGHERGAFTGATERHRGSFEQADGGTIFLDELGELDLALQPKLLRVLENREIRRVGGDRAIPVNVRVVAATNRDLRQMVNAGTFREDLYYRLSVVAIELPSLRHRPEDIPLLVRTFLDDVASRRFPGEGRSFTVNEGRPASPSAVSLAGQHPRAQEHDRARGIAGRLDGARSSRLAPRVAEDTPIPIQGSTAESFVDEGLPFKEAKAAHFDVVRGGVSQGLARQAQRQRDPQRRRSGAHALPLARACQEVRHSRRRRLTFRIRGAMDLSFTPEQEAFRREVRSFLDSADARLRSVPRRRSTVTSRWATSWSASDPSCEGLDCATLAEGVRWARLGCGAALLVRGRAREVRGPDALALRARHGRALLIQFGTDAQRAYHLPRILSGEAKWCQGYSEPEAGSDLASLRTTAVDDGQGNLIVNGQKTWTTYGQYADWIFCLVRTDSTAKKQAGISFLLIDMKSQGVRVAPMLTTGHTPAFCDTWFENVIVPKENVVGPLHGGWNLAKALLGHERTLIGAVGLSTRALQRVKRIARETMVDGRPLLEVPAFRRKVAQLDIALDALRMQNYRVLSGAQLGHAPGPESSILKIRGSEIQQQCFELAMEVMGQNSLAWFNDQPLVSPLEQWVASSFNYLRATTIYGGSNEIQRNVIAKISSDFRAREEADMDFELNEDQRLLRDGAANFTKTSPIARMRALRSHSHAGGHSVGWERSLWTKMAEMGWLGLPFAEDVGGLGLGFFDLTLVLEELARTLVPEPLLASVVAAGSAVDLAGSHEQRCALLGPMTEGKTSLALAWAEPGLRYDGAPRVTVLQREGGSLRLVGEKVWVLNGTRRTPGLSPRARLRGLRWWPCREAPTECRSSPRRRWMGSGPHVSASTMRDSPRLRSSGKRELPGRPSRPHSTGARLPPARKGSASPAPCSG